MLQFQDNYPLKNITTLGIGGPAKKFIIVKTQEELIEAIEYAKSQQIPYLVIGGGSNLLVADEGVDCLIIKNEIVGIRRHLPGEQKRHLEGGVTISIKSGTPLRELVDYAIANGLSGLQKLAGIPGTVGGAVYGNAGAYGQTISDIISQVKTFDGQNIITLTKSKCQFNYRDSAFKRNHYSILEVTFQLEKGESETLQQQAKEVLEKRLVKYPPGIKCPGSFFKNIVASTLSKEILDKIPSEKIVYGKLPAGALLEMVGAKGDSEDGIYIADYHANLFINKGNGVANDFYNLAKKYADKVYEKFGITLKPEVQLINLPSLD